MLSGFLTFARGNSGPRGGLPPKNNYFQCLTEIQISGTVLALLLVKRMAIFWFSPTGRWHRQAVACVLAAPETGRAGQGPDPGHYRVA